MNDRERLIKILEKAPKSLRYEDLPDYLFENGVIVLPCKIGDNVYEITKDCFNCSYLKDYSDTYICERNTDRNLFDVDYEKDCKYKISKIVFTYSLVPYIGGHVFLTKEEAERALKEMINKDA